MAALILFWLMCGGVAAVIAGSKGGSGFLGFLAGAVLGPLGIVLAFFLGSEQAKTEHEVNFGSKKRCPKCAEAIQRAAVVCRFCGYEFPAEEEVEYDMSRVKPFV